MNEIKSDVQIYNLNNEKGGEMSIWKHKNFLILFISGAMVSLGGRVYELALPLIVYDLYPSTTVMGVVKALDILPNLLLAMFIGVLVDRSRKKLFIQLATFVQVIFLVALFIAITTNSITLFLFYTSVFILKTFNYSYQNVRTTIVKNVVPQKLLTPANASFQFISTILTIMVPTITGFLLLLSDLKIGLIITAGGLLIATLINQFLVVENDHQVSKGRFLENFKAGWEELLSNRPLCLLTILVVFTNTTEAMIFSMLVFFAKDTLHLNSSIIGLVFSVAGVGGILGSVIVTYLKEKLSTGKVLGYMIFFTTISYFLFYIAKNEYYLSLALFLEAFFGTIYVVCIATLRQEMTPHHLIGRISGITGSLYKIGAVISILISGWVSNYIGISNVFLIAAITNLLIFIFFVKSPLLKMK